MTAQNLNHKFQKDIAAKNRKPIFGIWLFVFASTALPLPDLLGQIPSTSQLKTVELVPPPTQAIRSLNDAMQRRGSVTFRDTPIAEAILAIGKEWEVNIFAGADITGTVSGSFRGASLRDVLDSVLTVNGFGYRQNGGGLLVLKQADVGPNNPEFRIETIALPRDLDRDAWQDIIGALRVLSSQPGGQLQAVPSNNSIVVNDTPDRINQMRQLLQNLLNGTQQGQIGAQAMPQGAGHPLETLRSNVPEFEIITLRPQYITVAELAKGVEMVIGTQGTLVAIEGEEALLISGHPEMIRRASQVLSQLDRARPQVRITAYIYDVAIGEAEASGIDWSSRVFGQGVDANGIPKDMMRNDSGLLTRNQPASIVGNSVPLGSTTTTAAAASGATGPQWVFRTLSGSFELNTAIQALDETKGAKLLADPHVTVLDRYKATIDIITKVPIQQLTQTQQGGTIGTTAFEEAGVKLAVTPRISNDNTIQMIVTPEVSVLTGFSNGNPIIDARRSTTTVRIGNQQTLVIGGLRQKTMVETVRGIPGLMNVKYIGKLFRSHNTELKESELIVFLQPEIIDYCTTGLPREELAVEQAKTTLSRLPTACLGPHSPDCKDRNCPHHHPRVRTNQGLPDDGFVNPAGYSPEFNLNGFPVQEQVPVNPNGDPNTQANPIYPSEIYDAKTR